MDFIGSQLAIMSDRFSALPAGSSSPYVSVYWPKGDYMINMLDTSRGTERGLLTMRGYEGRYFGDGIFSTAIRAAETGAAYDSDGSAASVNVYKLLKIHRNGGPVTQVEQMRFRGPIGMSTSTVSVTLIEGGNTNAVKYTDLWLSACGRGLRQQSVCSTTQLTRVTLEFCNDTFIHCLDGGVNDTSMTDCVVFAGTPVTGQKGILLNGNNDEIKGGKIGEGFTSGEVLVTGTGAIIANVEFTLNDLGFIDLLENVTFTGNSVIADTSVLPVQARKDCIITSNRFSQVRAKPCLNLGDTTINSATNITVANNIFFKDTSGGAGDDNAVTAREIGTDFVGAATESCIIHDNIFTGGALTNVGQASEYNNVFDGTFTP